MDSGTGKTIGSRQKLNLGSSKIVDSFDDHLSSHINASIPPNKISHISQEDQLMHGEMVENTLIENDSGIEKKYSTGETQPLLVSGHAEVSNLNSDEQKSTDEIANLSSIIQLQKEALDLIPPGDPVRPQRLHCLGLAFQDRYRKTGDTPDLDNAIQLHQESVEMTPEGHSDRSCRLDRLGLAYADRFLRAGEIEDIDNAIQLHEMAINCLQEGHPERPGILDNLGLAYHDRSQRTGSTRDIAKALSLHQEAVGTTAKGHHDQPRRIHNLGLVYHDRFQKVGDITDIDKAIQMYQEAADLTPKNRVDRSGWLHNLGVAYHDKHQVTGTVADLDRAIQLHQESLKSTPEGHLDRPRRIDSLGLAYGNRYERMGALADLDEAIRLHEEAVDLTLEGHPDRARRLESLGLGHADRYRRIGKVEDLNKAIHLHQEAVDATPVGHPDRPGRLENLGLAHQAKFQESKAAKSLDIAIQLHQEGVRATLPDNPNLPRRLNSLGRVYQERFQQRGALEDLSKAIQLYTEAVKAIPEGHPARSDILHNLGIGHRDMYQTTGNPEDLEKAIHRCQDAMDHYSSPTLDRVRPGKTLLALLVDAKCWPLAYKAARTAVSLAPLLTPRSLENSDKQHLLTEVVGLASDAAAVALMAEAPTYDAIQLLEVGRGIITGSLNDMRGDISDVRQKSPELADEYLQLRSQLDTPADSTFLFDELNSEAGLMRQFDQRYEAGQKLERTIQAIRALPGLDRFLMAPSEAELTAAAVPGPIVIINDFAAASFAPLRRPQSRSSSNQPIIIGCTILTQTPHGPWPRIWWIPTGPLAKFPIHAAGYHTRASSDTVLDRAISSYSSSSKALIQSRLRHVMIKEPQKPESIVLIGMQELQYATQEIHKLEGLCDSMQLQVIKPQPYRQDVLAALNKCDIFHFAGHGHSEETDPSQSALLLHDGPLTVASLFETNLRSRQPFLAYLSACGTGQTKHDGLIDESLHLMAACQLAGFRHVIGTLWQASDKSCLDIATNTYRWMERRKMSEESVSEGLHHASRSLRLQWVSENAGGTIFNRGIRVHEDSQVAKRRSCSTQRNPRHPRDIVSCDGTPLHWVPYVHFGV
ncbi:tpr domain protein [Fusarium subglutinans]|uniref:Tpr domain protein n=1 Tax=Gibberella subglutinans TaxID=42677 RepID=A0A8H5KVT6_GIBSU|nr:tpr domain protein [Fusarium subglutinans]KAF5579406.1 tpr domain protein [Fusarium subglutinans]